MSLLFTPIPICILIHPHRTTALKQLQELDGPPSVQMHDVPRESVKEHLGFGKDDEEGRDELDDRLAREFQLFRHESVTTVDP